MYELIIRRGAPGQAAFYQHFTLETDEDATVLWALEELDSRERLLTSDGEPAARIRWECGCRQKMCGACAMLINKKPLLACNAFLHDLGRVITLEPLSKFPLVQDLVVDKSVLHTNMVKMELWLRDGERKPQPPRHLRESTEQKLYRSASCIQCGLCLEACPNYTGLDDFCGAAFMNADYRMIYQEAVKKERKQMMKKADRHFGRVCSNSFACQEVCPAGIPLSQHISRLNALAWKSGR